MKKFQDTGQNYYWNFFSKKKFFGTYENCKSKWENVENKWIIINCQL